MSPETIERLAIEYAGFCLSRLNAGSTGTPGLTDDDVIVELIRAYF